METSPHAPRALAATRTTTVSTGREAQRSVDGRDAGGARLRRAGPRKLLLVDDCALIRASLGEGLAAHDFDVVSSGNPFALSTLLTAERPALVLVDLGLPAIRGDKLIELVRKGAPEGRPMLVLFSGSGAELALRAKECGADGYVRKGGDAASIARALHDLLATHRP